MPEEWWWILQWKHGNTFKNYLTRFGDCMSWIWGREVPGLGGLGLVWGHLLRGTLREEQIGGGGVEFEYVSKHACFEGPRDLQGRCPRGRWLYGSEVGHVASRNPRSCYVLWMDSKKSLRLSRGRQSKDNNDPGWSTGRLDAGWLAATDLGRELGLCR